MSDQNQNNDSQQNQTPAPAPAADVKETKTVETTRETHPSQK